MVLPLRHHTSKLYLGASRGLYSRAYELACTSGICQQRGSALRRGRRSIQTSTTEAEFTSIVDNAPDLVRSGRRHGPGIIVLGNSTASWL